MSNGGPAFQSWRVLPTPLESWAMRRGDDSFNAIAGSLGGFMSGLVTCPLDVIKTKLQAQGGFRIRNDSRNSSGFVYQGMIGTAKVIWQQEGLKGMYRGLGPIILGYLPTWAVWFTIYARSKQLFGRYVGMFLRSTNVFLMITYNGHREPQYCQFLVFYCRRRLFFYGYKSDMGDQNTFDVTS